jgi:hypothetical protein
VVNRTGVVVSLDDAYLGRITEIARELRAQGMKIDQTLAEIGVITGSIAGTDPRPSPALQV